MELGAAIIQVLWVKVLFGHFLRPQYYNYRVLILNPSRYQIWLVCVFDALEFKRTHCQTLSDNLYKSWTHYQSTRIRPKPINDPLPNLQSKFYTNYRPITKTNHGPITILSVIFLLPNYSSEPCISLSVCWILDFWEEKVKRVTQNLVILFSKYML